jgi:hypothetical protein
MGDLVLRISERRAKPVDDVMSNVRRSVENNHVGDDVNTSHSLASIKVDVLNLFLNFVALYRSLQNSKNTTNAGFFLNFTCLEKFLMLNCLCLLLFNFVLLFSSSYLLITEVFKALPKSHSFLLSFWRFPRVPFPFSWKLRRRPY